MTSLSVSNNAPLLTVYGCGETSAFNIIVVAHDFLVLVEQVWMSNHVDSQYSTVWLLPILYKMGFTPYMKLMMNANDCTKIQYFLTCGGPGFIPVVYCKQVWVCFTDRWISTDSFLVISGFIIRFRGFLVSCTKTGKLICWGKCF